MHLSNLDSLIAAEDALTTRSNGFVRRWLTVEFDRRGIFLRLGGSEAYFCVEPDRAWSLVRDKDGFDAQVWRLHLIVGKVPE